MTWINLSDVESQLSDAGLLLDTVKAPKGGVPVGRLYVGSTASVRCDVSGIKKKGTGSYRLHELHVDDGIFITGAYWLDHGNAYHTIELRKACRACGRDGIDLKAKVCPSCGEKQFKAREISEEERAAHKQRMLELRRQAEREARAAADRAAHIAQAVWRACTEITDLAAHDYLGRKQLTSAHGARLFNGTEGLKLPEATDDEIRYLAQFAGALVVPMCDRHGQPRALQFILSRSRHADRIQRKETDKEFWPKGMANDGLYFLIGGAVLDVALVCEGYATGATLHEASGLPVACAFQANRMQAVGEILRKQTRRRARLLFAADDDWLQHCDACKQITTVQGANCDHCGQPHKRGNAGIEQSRAAALACDGAWFMPKFATERTRLKKGDTDFNDLRCREGMGPVSAQITEQIVALGWKSPRVAGLPAPLAQSQGGGEGGLLPARLSIDEAAARYSLIYGGKGTLFDHVEHMLVPKGDVLDILPPRAWDMLKMHPLWQPRRLSEVGFDPTGRDARISCNLWGGWPTTPVPGKCEALLALLLHLCSREKNASEVYQFALKWLALPIQQPGAKLATALVFHGPQGQGKNLFFEAVMAIYGEYGRIIDQAAIEDKFNDWASRKLFMIADEVVARAELFHLKNKLKGFITGEWVRINPKNVAAHDERNHVNLVFLSNEDMPLHVEIGDRRYTVVRTPSELPAALVEAVKAEIAAGGIAAMHHHLATLPLGDFHAHSKPPMTEAKRDLIEYGMGSVERFARDWCRGEVEIAGKPLPFGPVGSAQIYKAYALWCRGQGELRPRPQNQFAGSLGNLPGWEKGFKDRFDNFNSSETKRWRCLLPSPGAMAAAKLLRLEPDLGKTDAETQTDWLTRCFFAFEQALEERP